MDDLSGAKSGDASRLPHTAEEWTYTHNSWDVSTIYDGNGEPVAIVEINSDVTEDTQDKYEAQKDARAQLIAAAPDLLAALSDCVQTWRALGGTAHLWLTKADTAIAKARATDAGSITDLQTASNPNQQSAVAVASRMEEALRELVNALDACRSSIINAFVFQQNHGIVYTGPTYEKELNAARALLPPAPEEKRHG